MKIVKQGQCFLDKITQLTGSFENALSMALLNNRSITDDVEIGLEIKTDLITNKSVVAFFNRFNEPATNTGKEQLESVENLGIGKMVIENTFIVR